MASSDIESLQALSTSPYLPEPPRKSVVVDVFMWIANRKRGARLITPHLHGGTDAEKVDWEIRHLGDFWEMLRALLGPDGLNGKTVLDVGCGWGGKAIYMAEHTQLEGITGFDLPGIFDPAVPSTVATSRGISRCTFTTGHAEDMPFDAETFDVALMDDVLEHVREPTRVLRECHRVLRSEGVLFARFPSIRMAGAHHFERALNYPGLHYLMPMRRWAQGFNHYLLHNQDGVKFEPFSEIVDTTYRTGVTRNLNGVDFEGARQAVLDAGFQVERLELIGYRRSSFGSLASILYPVYRVSRLVPKLREIVSRTIVLVAKKPA